MENTVPPAATAATTGTAVTTTTTTVIPRPEEMMAAMYANLSQMQTQNSRISMNLELVHSQNAQLVTELGRLAQAMPNHTNSSSRIPFKLELPKFAGTNRENVTTWTHQMDAKFNLANVPEDQRGLWAMESLTGLAAQIVANSGITEWD